MIVGPVTAVHQLRRAVIATLQDWLVWTDGDGRWQPGWPLVDIAQQTGVDVDRLPPVRAWHRVAAWDDVSESQQPVVFATSPGLVGEPERRAREWRSVWEVPVMVAVRGQDYDDTADLVSVFAAAIRTTVLREQPTVDGVEGWWWAGETYDALPADQQRTWAGALVTFHCAASEVVQERPERDRPDTPFDDAKPIPTVEQVDVTWK